MPEKKQIMYGAISDTPLPIIMDEAPGISKRFYPYKLDKTGDKTKEFIASNAMSLVSFVNVEQSNLNVDENGNYYMNGISDDIMNSNFYESEIGTSASSDLTEGILTNEFYDNPDGCLHIVTKDIPFDPELYDSGEQVVYVVSNNNRISGDFTNGLGEESELRNFVVSDEGLVNFNLMDIRIFIETYSNSKIKFLRGFSVSDFDIDIDGESRTGFTLTLPNDCLLSRVSLEGTDNSGRDKYFDLDTSAKMIPLKMTPTNINGRQVTGYSSFIDTELSMPIFIAQSFADGSTIEQVFIDALTDDDGNVPAITTYEDELKLIIDVISYSQAIMTNFKDFNRLDGTQGNAGALDPEQHIGSSNQYISTLEGRDPYEVTKSILDNYHSLNPEKEEEPSYLIAKTILSGLSKYILFDYAIAGGGQNFVESYSPWYLINTSPISLVERTFVGESGEVVNAWGVEDDITFQLDSRYFDLSRENIIDLETSKINVNRLLNTYPKTELPNMPDILSQVSVSNYPLTVPVDASSLSYNCYVPSDNLDALTNIYFKGQTEISEGEQVLTFTTEQFYEGEVTDVNVFIREQAILRYPQLANQTFEIQFIGTLNTVSLEPYIFTTDAFEFRDIVGNVLGNVSTENALKLFNSNYPQYTDIPYTRFINTLVARDNPAAPGFVTEVTGELDIEFTRQQYSGARVVVSGGIVDIDFESRSSSFSKDDWQLFISQNVNTIPNVPINFDIPIYSRNSLITNVNSISIYGMWLNNMTISFDQVSIDIQAIANNDETIAVQKIIFT